MIAGLFRGLARLESSSKKGCRREVAEVRFAMTSNACLSPGVRRAY